MSHVNQVRYITTRETHRNPRTARHHGCWAGLFRPWFVTVVLLAGCADPVFVTGNGEVQGKSGPAVEDLVGKELRPDLSVIAPAPEITTDALAVRFRQQPGFYEKPFELQIKGADPTAQIIYTLDGSLPDRAAIEDVAEVPEADGVIRRRTFRYNGPIDLAPWLARPNQLSLIDTGLLEGQRGYREVRKPKEFVAKSVVVRAQAVSGEYVSPVISGTYFVDPRGRERYSLPVVSLSTEPAYLFNSRIGAYVRGDDPELPNFAQVGDDWERPAYFEFFDGAGERPLAQWLGIRIHGAYSRSFPQKSLRLLARKEYGPSALQYPFFETKPDSKYKRLLLRNGGNDWGEAYFRDSAMQSLVQHFPFETQHAQPAVVFINGEYWGLHEIRDRLDQFHLEVKYGVPRENIVILENDGLLNEGTNADVKAYREFVKKLEAGKFPTWEAVEQHVAVSEYLDYAIVHTYAGNTDWPNNNFAFWRFSGPQLSPEHGPRDGRWRPLLFDVDRSLGRNNSTTANIVDRAFSDRFKAAGIFRGMIAVREIRHEFIQRVAVHLATTFDAQRVASTINDFTRRIEPEIPEQIARWGYPKTMDKFYDHVERSHAFAEVRPNNVRRDMAAFFDEITGLAKVRIENIDPANPPILHGVRLSNETPGVKVSNGAWQGTVFAGVPLVVTVDNQSVNEASVEGATVSSFSGRLEVTLEPNSNVTIRLPSVFSGR